MKHWTRLHFNDSHRKTAFAQSVIWEWRDGRYLVVVNRLIGETPALARVSRSLAAAQAFEAGRVKAWADAEEHSCRVCDEWQGYD